MLKKITSTHNPLIKELVQLQEKSRIRKQKQCFLIEGVREIQLALQGGYHLEKILINTSIISILQVEEMTPQSNDVEYVEISEKVYKKLAFRDSTEGIIAVARSHNLHISNLQNISKNPLFLVAEAPEKPGNIGALLRTADAAGVTAVLIANPKTDMYNPNIIRSSVGGVFTTKIAVGSSAEIISFLQQNNIAIYATSLQASVPYHTVNYKQPTAIVVGTEATGLTQEWTNQSLQNIIIPMRGKIDSMNVSVSAAIIIFEAVRQRNL